MVQPGSRHVGFPGLLLSMTPLVMLGLALEVQSNEPTATETATAQPTADQPATFNRDIAPLVFQNCASCHRPGEVAPFSLLSYEDVKKRAELIQTVTADRTMPPWKGVEGHGQFIGERRLSTAQLDLLARWIKQGAVEGEAGDLPPAPQFSEEWKLGPPDIVISMPEAYEVPADGADIYRNFAFQVSVPVGKYIKAAEFRPGNKTVVHHAILASDPTGKARQRDADDPAPGFKGSLSIPGRLFPGSMAAWTPGRDPLPLPEGLSMPWPEGGDMILQLHLHPSGKTETVQSSVGLYLTDEAPIRSMVDLMLIDKRIDIPAGEKSYRTRDEIVLPIEMDAYGLFPHMHLIGRDIKVTAQPPDGAPISLLWIEDWDFNWQNFYQYTKPVRLPAGSRLILEAVHDNSADNIHNPYQPPRRVTWGEQTVNEMTVAVLQLVPTHENELAQLAGTHRSRLVGAITAGNATTPASNTLIPDAKQVLAKFDANGDGKLSMDEMALASGKNKATVEGFATPFDKDGDGALNVDELQAALRRLVQR